MSEPSVKSKSQLRAERRAVQEAQRAAKLAAKNLKSEAPAPKSDATKLPTSKVAQSKITEENFPKKPVAQPLHSSTTNQTTTNASLAKQNIETSHHPGPFPTLPTRKQESNRVHLFRHLKEPDRRTDVVANLGLGSCSPIDPTFIALGVNLDEGRLLGSNEVALHFLSACATLVHRHHPSAMPNQHTQSSFTRQFGPVLQRHFEFLAHCRSPTVTMHSAYQYVKQALNQLDSVYDWEECRSRLLSAIDEFCQQSIYLAGAEIAERASVYIRPGDCVCTFGYSSVVARVLLRTWSGSDELVDLNESNSGCGASIDSRADSPAVPFSVVVVDARPKFTGRRMLARLVQAGIPCEYTHIAALPSLSHKISLAIVGADALLNNGYVLAPIGTAQVANVVSAVAHAPILVCAETYKFCERAHSDAFEFNELGDPDDCWRCSRDNGSEFSDSVTTSVASKPNELPSEYPAVDLSTWRSNNRLHLLHLTYDVLPPVLVSAVVTEKGTLPTSSVPVVLRVKQASAIIPP